MTHTGTEATTGSGSRATAGSGYLQPAKDKRPPTWQVVRVIANDQAGRKVAECQATPGPGNSC